MVVAALPHAVYSCVFVIWVQVAFVTVIMAVQCVTARKNHKIYSLAVKIANVTFKDYIII